MNRPFARRELTDGTDLKQKSKAQIFSLFFRFLIRVIRVISKSPTGQSFFKSPKFPTPKTQMELIQGAHNKREMQKIIRNINGLRD
ncbi:hypothetical protein PN36_24790 [Candidatus Thiomargarita nelsonii]|uniref:Uncharacterized protein n=1 Tax=Candidatus Thiomargarita nelsonii TaxID=1003181 RepID=A0A4E0QT87_9GAMM|nr:hypothetical protein PN36_24790 [Candidatus Thiomargarita nelsonii]